MTGQGRQNVRPTIGEVMDSFPRRGARLPEEWAIDEARSIIGAQVILAETAGEPAQTQLRKALDLLAGEDWDD